MFSEPSLLRYLVKVGILNCVRGRDPEQLLLTQLLEEAETSLDNPLPGETSHALWGN